MAKVRSPNYPALDLGAALEAVRPAWKAEHRNKMARSVLAKHLGYSSLNGRALGKIGAVRAYGLIDGSGDDLRISDDAITALASPDKVNIQYREAMERLALKPSLFTDIKKQFPGTLPSDGNLSYWLVQNGFTQDAAGKAAKAFLATMRLVYDESPPYKLDESYELAEPEMMPEQPVPSHENKGGGLGFVRAAKGLTKSDVLQEVFNLHEGPVTLTVPATLSEESYEDLEAQFQLFLRRAKRRVAKSGNEEAAN